MARRRTTRSKALAQALARLASETRLAQAREARLFDQPPVSFAPPPGWQAPPTLSPYGGQPIPQTVGEVWPDRGAALERVVGDEWPAHGQPSTGDEWGRGGVQGVPPFPQLLPLGMQPPSWPPPGAGANPIARPVFDYWSAR